jgi:hypothetical protein
MVGARAPRPMRINQISKVQVNISLYSENISFLYFNVLLRYTKAQGVNVRMLSASPLLVFRYSGEQRDEAGLAFVDAFVMPAVPDP